MSKERDEFIAVLTEARIAVTPKGNGMSIVHITEVAQKLMRLGRESKTLAERECNEPLPEGYVEKKRGSIRDRVAIELAKLGLLGKRGCGYSVGGDPRGYTLKLQLPTKRYNTWGGKEEGWGVPNS